MSCYHNPASCNKCGDGNKITTKDTINGQMSEAETVCIKCGHEDYWSHGYFESGSEIVSKCKKY